ncbi:unnamed protein product [Mesocestoides corti]|uniref:BTB domain-containing protein n=1 Tax=Mesocestoides corti TaxID=53468 RepID=A0A0R3U8Q3_MESCO|nr:unnamed protein product [Mesocestoides corti]
MKQLHSRLVCILDALTAFEESVPHVCEGAFLVNIKTNRVSCVFTQARTFDDGHEVAAHRVVLASRFPHLEQAVTNCVGRRLRWRRYDRDIVEAVVRFAYTGSIEISMDNAVRLFLLASNLGSRTITSWCAEFLRPRVSRENVEQIWSVANATKNTRMIDLCVPFIAAHFDAITTGVKFQSTTEPDSLSTLLSDDRLVGVAEAAKLRAVAMWFEANRTANTEDLTEFVGGLDNSLGAIDLGKITSDDFVEFCMSDCWINLRREFSRDLISNAWKEVRMRGPTHDYLIAYTDPSNEVTFATSEWEEFEKKILGRSSGAQLPTVDVNFRLTMPSRSECAVVMLSESMYMIGGRDEKGEVSRLVDRVDPFDGRVLGAAPMEHERCSFSAAADFSGQQLLVFGGENGGCFIAAYLLDWATDNGIIDLRTLYISNHWLAILPRSDTRFAGLEMAKLET